ncbi:MAG: class I SAM-dependent methyltransferase [Patescibacteria group bacterium]|nr:class I SAM-dependent methyltransferase [Patescibacteria group bacterium]MDE2438443.1 class I SAM-dependent methyltransferase [Patescibacteria group bacterium]
MTFILSFFSSLWHTHLKPFLQRLNFLYARIYLLKGTSFEPKEIYQSRFVHFNLKPGEKVLDVGSGGEPFAQATHLCDLYPQKTQHRYNELKTNGLPFTQASVEDLPFKDKEFDFAYCAHVLEHVEDPAKACRELMRVAGRGYIETPTRISDIMCNFTRIPNFHRWHVTQVGNTLIFNEYQSYEQRDMGTDEFYHMIHAKYPNRIQTMYRRNKDLFSNMFLWEGGFNYYVFNLHGELVSSFHYQKK